MYDDEEELNEELRRRESRHRGPGVAAVRGKEARVLGLRVVREVENDFADLIAEEGRRLMASEAEIPAFQLGGALYSQTERDEESAVASTQIEPRLEPTWRTRERMKTVSVALILCLNIGTDPPDSTMSASPRARKECWLDPLASPSREKGLEAIGAALQAQYERWQNRARYRQVLDPTADDLRRLCTNLRRSAKNDRILLHYNGHGVPRPTLNGEIWVFNKNYTQYIPISIHEIRGLAQSPAVYVLDCSGAGALLPHLAAPLPSRQFTANQTDTKSPTPATHASSNGGGDNNKAERKEQSTQGIGDTKSDRTASLRACTTSSKNDSNNANKKKSPEDFEQLPENEDTRPPPSSISEACIALAPCAADETLPSDPRLPADLFTACLTTPIAVALRWFVRTHPESTGGKLSLEILEDGVPGTLGNRKTPLGELNWIFTAVTDTIAWNALPAPLFQRLFRQDLLLASLFRNFLLAERVLKAHGCTPQTLPRLPATNDHPLWAAWDLAAEACLAQLALGADASAMAGTPTPTAAPGSASGGNPMNTATNNTGPGQQHNQASSTTTMINGSQGHLQQSGTMPPQHEVKPSPERELRTLRGLARLTAPPPRALAASAFFEEQLTAFEVWLRFGAASDALESPPEQLPVVLQVLLSQAHRVRALLLLRRFLELSPRAVNLALCVGIFPYVLKLLQSPAPELRRPLVAIWASILAFDPSCKHDLIKDGALVYFVAHASKLAELRNTSRKLASSEANVLGLSAAAEGGAGTASSSTPQTKANANKQPSTAHSIGANSGMESEELEDQSVLTAFVISSVVRGPDSGPKMACLSKHLEVALHALLRQRRLTSSTRRRGRLVRWLCLAVAAFCDFCDAARVAARATSENGSLLDELSAIANGGETDPTARAAAVRALAAACFREREPAQQNNGVMAAATNKTNETPAPPTVQMTSEERSAAWGADAGIIAAALNAARREASTLVRRELALALSELLQVPAHRRGLLTARDGGSGAISTTNNRIAPKAAKLLGLPGDEEKSTTASKNGQHDYVKEYQDSYRAIWSALVDLASDPAPSVAEAARQVVNFLEEMPTVPYASSGIEHWARQRFVTEVHSSSVARALAKTKHTSPYRKPPKRTHLKPRKQSSQKKRSMVTKRPLRNVRSTVSESDTSDSEEDSDLETALRCDPLSMAGDLRLYRRHRNRYTMREARLLADKVRLALDQDDDVGGGHGQPSPSGLVANANNANAPPPLKFVSAATLDNQGADMTRHLRFHPHEPYLAVVDDKHGISLWHYEQSQCVGRWPNCCAMNEKVQRSSSGSFGEVSYKQSSRDSSSSLFGGFRRSWRRNGSNESVNSAWPRVTAVEWLDAAQDSLLLCGSDDGVCRVWHGFSLEEAGHASSFDANESQIAGGIPHGQVVKPRLLTSFVAADDILEPANSRSSGLVTTWSQTDGLLLAAGDSPYLRAWDVRGQQLAAAWPLDAGHGNCVTALSYHSGVVFAGFGDGALKIIDPRVDKVVSAFGKEHSAWIIHLSSYDVAPQRQLLSACLDGNAKFWDFRAHRRSMLTINVQSSTMTAFVAHPTASLLASGSHNQFINFLSRDGRQLNIVRYHEGFFLGQRISPVSALAFHPSKLLAATGATDSFIGIYACCTTTH